MAAMVRPSRIATRIAVMAGVLAVAGCAVGAPPAAIDPSALLQTDDVVAFVRHPSPLLRASLVNLLEAHAWPDAADAYDAVAVVHDGDTLGWIGFTLPTDTRVSRLPAAEASPPSLLALVATGATTLSTDAFFRGSAAAASDVRSWAYVTKLRADAPLSVHPVAILSDTGALAFLWMDHRPAAIASVGATVPALPARGAVWFADGDVLLSMRSALHEHIGLSMDALLSAAVLQTFGASTAPRELAGLLRGPGTLLIGPKGGSGSPVLLAGSARDDVAERMADVRERFIASRPRMEIDKETFERGFTNNVIRTSPNAPTDVTDATLNGWTLHAVRQPFDNAELVTAERDDAFVLGSDRATVDAFLVAGTGTLALPRVVSGTQREAAGVIDADVLPPSLAKALSPLFDPLGGQRLLWSLDRTGGATALTLRAE